MTDEPSAAESSDLVVLRHELARLHRRDGERSLREIARQAKLSHTTVGEVLRCERPGRWSNLREVVTVLSSTDGDVERFQALWVAVRDAQDQAALASSSHAGDDSTVEAANTIEPKSMRPASVIFAEIFGWSSGQGPMWGVALTGDGRLLASAGHNSEIRLWDPGTGQPIGEPLTGHLGAVRAVALTGDGRLLASAGHDGRVRLWDTGTGQPVGGPLTGDGLVWGVALSGDGRLLATGGRDGTVRLWDPAAGQPIGEPLPGHRAAVWAVAFTSDGRLLAAGGDDGTVRLWNPDTGRSVGEPLAGHRDAVRAVAFSGDGRLLASASHDGRIRLWDAATGKPVGEALTGHLSSVWAVAFTFDGGLLASAGQDGTVRLWNPGTGQPVGEPLTGHQGAVRAVALADDGQLLASAGHDGTIRLWAVQAADHEPGSEDRRLRARIEDLRAQRDAAQARVAELTAVLNERLPVDGQPPAGRAYRALAWQPSRLIQGRDVLDLQRQLVALGFGDDSLLDGVFGEQTDLAVRQFQNDYAVLTDGVCGRVTQRVLKYLELNGVDKNHSASPQQLHTIAFIVRGQQGSFVVADLVSRMPRPTDDRSASLMDSLIEKLGHRLEARIASYTGMQSWILTSADISTDDEDEIAAFANRIKAELMITLSVANSADAGPGCATYFFGSAPTVYSHIGWPLAESVHMEIVRTAQLPDRRVHAEYSRLFEQTESPTIRVEIGNLADRYDQARLDDNRFLDSVAIGIAAGIKKFYLLGQNDDEDVATSNLGTLSP